MTIKDLTHYWPHIKFRENSEYYMYESKYEKSTYMKASKSARSIEELDWYPASLKEYDKCLRKLKIYIE